MQDFMSDLAVLRAKYLANTPMPPRSVLQSHELLEGVKSARHKSLKVHRQRVVPPSAVQGSSDILTDSCVSERCIFRQVEPQGDTIAAWRRSRSSIGAPTVHPRKPIRPIRWSQASHPQLMEEYSTCFTEPTVPGASGPEDMRDYFMRRSCSSGAAEQDTVREALQRSAPGHVTHEHDHDAGRYSSPIAASQGIYRAAFPQAASRIRHSSASGYLCIEQTTPPPLGGSSGVENSMRNSVEVEPARTPLTDCLRDFFAQRAASREMESQEQDAAVHHAGLQDQHECTQLSSTSCRIAAAAEARMRTAGALQAAEHVYQSMVSIDGPAALTACERQTLTSAATDLECTVQPLGGDENSALQHVPLNSSLSTPHETCSAAQKVRESYPDIFQPNASPSFRSAWSAPGTLLPLSCAPQELSMSIHRSTDVHVSSSSTWAGSHDLPGALMLSARSPANWAAGSGPPEQSPQSGADTGNVSPVSSANSCGRREFGQVSIDDPVLISGLSQRAQKLLSLGRALGRHTAVTQSLEHNSVDASVDHWAAPKPRESSVGSSISDVLRACGLPDVAVQEILSQHG